MVHTRAMAFTPPMMTEAARIHTKSPTAQSGTPNVLLANRAMELACTVHPIPNDASAVNTAKRIASHFMFRPRSKAYIGPPYVWPSSDFTRYFTASKPSAYFVAIPKIPVNQHHSTAPGPPKATAVATPTMFPVPMVAAKAVAKAPNWLTSPSAPGSFFTDRRMPVNNFLWGMRRRNVRNTCVPNNSTIMGQPHRKSPASKKKSLIVSISVQFACKNTKKE